MLNMKKKKKKKKRKLKKKDKFRQYIESQNWSGGKLVKQSFSFLFSIFFIFFTQKIYTVDTKAQFHVELCTQISIRNTHILHCAFG